MKTPLLLSVGLLVGLGLGSLWRAGRTGAAEPAGPAGHAHGAAGAHAGHDGGDVAPPAHAGHAGHGGAGEEPEAGDARGADPMPDPMPGHGAEPGGASAADLAAAERLEVDLENEVCPVMGGDARESIYVVWRGVRVRFCCNGCDEDFLAAPEALLAEIGVDPTLALEVAARLEDATPERRAAVCEEYGHRVRIVPAEEGR